MALSQLVETVFVLRGVDAAVSGFRQIGTAAATAAGKVKGVTSGGGAAAGGLAGRAGAAGEGIAGLFGNQAVITAGVAGGLLALRSELEKATQAWAEDEQAVFRAAVILRNMGTSLPIGDLQNYASTLQQTIAIDDEAIVSLGGLLSRFKLTGEQIKQTIPAIIDASKTSGRSIEDIGLGLGKTLQGGRNALRDLGVEFKSTGNRAADLKNIIDQLNRSSLGAAKAERNTTIGSQTAFSEEVANARSAFGKSFEDTIGRRSREAAIRTLRNLQAPDEDPGSTARRAGASPEFAFLRWMLHPKANTDPAAGVGDGKSKAEDLLGEIATNTAMTKDAITSSILGGGAVARGALNIRSLNAAMRATF